MTDTQGAGNIAQNRLIMEQAIEATIIKLRETERPKVELPASLKLWGGIGASLLTITISGVAFWVVTTLSEVQLAVREVNTQLSAKGAVEVRFAEFNRRITELESRVATNQRVTEKQGYDNANSQSN